MNNIYKLRSELKFLNEFQRWVDSVSVPTTRGKLRHGFGWMKFQDSPTITFIVYLSSIISRMT